MDSNLSVKLANVNDIPDKGAIVVTTAEGLEIALFRKGQEIFALENSCPHQGGPLSEGIIEEGCITCPWHGWQFDMVTGICQNMPGEDARSISFEVIGGEIFLRG